MMKNMTKALFLLFFLARIANAQPENFALLTEDAPPTNYLNEQSRLVGSSAEIVREILARIGWSTDIQVLPWARAYEMALQGPNVALFSTARTKEREDLFKWVGPIFEQRQVLYKSAASPIRINSLEDARKVESIGTYYNDAAEQYLKKNGFANLESAPEDELNVRKLVLGRIQLWATGDAAIQSRIRKTGFDPASIEEAYTLQTIELFIAFSPTTSDTTTSLWQTALNEMKSEGLYQQILQKYSR